MKKCPFCAEEIQDDAVKCKHCKSVISSLGAIKDESSTRASKKKKTSIGKMLVMAILVLFGIFLWFISIPVIVIWYVWKKTKLTKKNKIFATAVFIAVYSVAMIFYADYSQSPEITLNSPTDGSTVSSVVEVVGSVKPESSIIEVNKEKIAVVDGKFNLTLSLPNPDLNIVILANHNNRSVEKKITVHRPLTEEETVKQVEHEKMIKEATEKRAAEVAAQKEAEEKAAKQAQAEWDNSKAGKLCKAHSGWTKEDCQRLVNEKIWIGMSLEMLKTFMGKPSSANPSNYGGGTHWQWCWHDYTPSCFYGGDDEIITSYN